MARAGIIKNPSISVAVTGRENHMSSVRPNNAQHTDDNVLVSIFHIVFVRFALDLSLLNPSDFRGCMLVALDLSQI